MKRTIAVPSRFYYEALSVALSNSGQRIACGMPEVSEDRKRTVVVRADDPNLSNLLNLAEGYSNPSEDVGLSLPQSIRNSAVATVRAIRNVIGWEGAEPHVQLLRKDEDSY